MGNFIFAPLVLARVFVFSCISLCSHIFAHSVHSVCSLAVWTCLCYFDFVSRLPELPASGQRKLGNHGLKRKESWDKYEVGEFKFELLATESLHFLSSLFFFDFISEYCHLPPPPSHLIVFLCSREFAIDMRSITFRYKSTK